MQTAARTAQRVCYWKTFLHGNHRANVVQDRTASLVHVYRVNLSPPILRSVSGLSGASDKLRHNLLSCHDHKVPSSWYSDVQEKPEQTYNLDDNACPQGVQGDDCVTFKLWLENCRRYSLANCNDQLQGIQSGRKTLAEVMADQEKLIAEIVEQYHLATHRRASGQNVQGLQDAVAALDVDMPCPQGVQGSDCAQFKIWLENCHRFGLHDCAQQLNSFKAGEKSLAEIFAEQDKIIREAATVAYQKKSKHRRDYSTSTKHPGSGPDTPPDAGEKPQEGQLSQRQKLQRAVKEYGSTVIVFHVTISLMSLGFFYLLVSSGIDVVGLLMKLGIGEQLLQNKLAAGTGSFVVAYAVHKVFAPVRIATTLTATPFIVRYLRRIGFLKVPQHSKLKA